MTGYLSLRITRNYITALGVDDRPGKGVARCTGNADNDPGVEYPLEFEETTEGWLLGTTGNTDDWYEVRPVEIFMEMA